MYLRSLGMNYHSFVIGQGIAGSVMALTLNSKGHQVKIFDTAEHNSSSVVSAGICNPITGKKQKLTWRAADFFEFSSKFYIDLERILDTKFYQSLPIYRILNNVGEQNSWSTAQLDESLKPFISKNTFHSLDGASYVNPFGCIGVEQGGWLNMIDFLQHVRNYFSSTDSFVNSRFVYNHVEKTDHLFKYGDDSAENIIYCTGLEVGDLWSNLPFTPMRGEILTISCPKAVNNAIVIGGCFVLPLGNDLYRVGSTYDWRNTEVVTTDAGRQEIELKLQKFLKLPYRVVDHDVGLRPAVKDRRPLIGQHESEPNVYLLSGLGSKGVSMAPKLAEWLYSLMEFDLEPPFETNLKRYLPK